MKQTFSGLIVRWHPAVHTKFMESRGITLRFAMNDLAGEEVPLGRATLPVAMADAIMAWTAQGGADLRHEEGR